MKVCYTGGAVKDCGSYYSVATNAVELRIWFLTDDILRIRAGFDGTGAGGYIASTVSPMRNGGKEKT